MNIETLLVQAYNAHGPLPEAFMEVPANRPRRFITVERVGGDRADVRDRPIVAIQAWEETRYKASELAAVIAEFTGSLAVTHPHVARVSIESVYNNPDPESESPRYQVNASITTT